MSDLLGHFFMHVMAREGKGIQSAARAWIAEKKRNFTGQQLREQYLKNIIYLFLAIRVFQVENKLVFCMGADVVPSSSFEAMSKMGELKSSVRDEVHAHLRYIENGVRSSTYAKNHDLFTSLKTASLQELEEKSLEIQLRHAFAFNCLDIAWGQSQYHGCFASENPREVFNRYQEMFNFFSDRLISLDLSEL